MIWTGTYHQWRAILAARAARNPQIDPRTVRAAEIARLRGEG
jgi:Fe-S-cluster formation regulator IscX/YfhJ